MSEDCLVNWSEEQLEARLDEVVVDAYGDYEQLGSFGCVLEELLERPVAASVIGEPVELISVREEGLGLRAQGAAGWPHLGSRAVGSQLRPGCRSGSRFDR